MKTFSKKFWFLNPTFSSREAVVRGICYGQPGETEMYKYQWKNFTIDTVEFVSYEKNAKGEKTGKVIISKKRFYDPQKDAFKRLNVVPLEYRRIEGFEWFEGIN